MRFGLIVIVCFFHWQAAYGADHVALPAEEVTRRLRENLETIDSLYIKWHAESEVTGGQPIRYNVWAEQSGRLLNSGDGVFDFHPRKWESFDGEFSYYVRFWAEDRTQTAEVIRKREKGTFDTQGYWPYVGLRLTGTDETILSLIEKDPPKMTGVEEIQGAKSYRFEFGPLRKGWKGFSHELSLWVDQEVFLPRRIYLRPENHRPPQRIRFGEGEALLDFQVESYKEVEDEARGVRRWFPYRISAPAAATVFDEVRINPSLTKSDFVPAMPPGTILKTDRMVPSKVNPKILIREEIVIGGDEGERIVRDRLAVAQAKAIVSNHTGSGEPAPNTRQPLSLSRPANGSVPNAAPIIPWQRRSSVWSWVSVAVSILLATLLLLHRRVSR